MRYRYEEILVEIADQRSIVYKLIQVIFLTQK